VALKIGLVSEQMVPSEKIPLALPMGTELYWFNEMEALFAYLQTDQLDEIYLDHLMLANPKVCAHRYQKLIAQLHPRLKISSRNISAAQEHFLGELKYYPKLDIMFKNGEIKSVFQPIVILDKNRQEIVGFECLSRLLFGAFNYSADYLFNYAQEKLELVNCDKICLMQSLSLAPKVKSRLIFVNVRPQTLISANFMKWLKEQLKKNQLDPAQLVVEITEQHCLFSESEMAEQCELLRKFGLSLAIDDFGSGVSNLSMLEIMRPDYIKISGKFIRSSNNNIAKQKIIKNVLDLAQDFNIKVIVESIENQAECQQLTSMGAVLAQGYYFHKPMEKSALLALLS